MSWPVKDILGVPRSNIEGVDRVINNLNRRMQKELPEASMKGILKAISYVRQEMDKSYPKIPVDYGNLRQSFFVTSSNVKIYREGGKTHTPEGATVNFKGPKAGEIAANHASTLMETMSMSKALSNVLGGPVAVFGFSANYAKYVHEKWDPSVNWKRRLSGPGFFEIHLKNNQGKMFDIIRENSKLKP